MFDFSIVKSDRETGMKGRRTLWTACG